MGFIILNMIASIFGIYQSLSVFISSLRPAFLAIYSVSLANMFIMLAIFTTYPMQHILPAGNVARASKTGGAPSCNLSSPEDSVTLWNWLTFNFLEPLLRLANQRTLNEEDVWDLPPTFKHGNLFRKYLQVQEEHPRSLLWVLLSSNSLDLIIDIILKMWIAVIGTAFIYANIAAHQIL